MGTLPAARPPGTSGVLGVTLPSARPPVSRCPSSCFSRPTRAATVWIQVPPARGPGPGPYVVGPLRSPGLVDLVRTNVVLEDVVRRQRLYLAPQGAGRLRCARDLQGQGAGAPGHVPTRGGRLRQELHALQHGCAACWSAASRAIRSRRAGLRLGPSHGDARGGAHRRVHRVGTFDAAKVLARDLKMSSDLDAKLVRLELHGHDPARVTATVNAVADASGRGRHLEARQPRPAGRILGVAAGARAGDLAKAGGRAQELRVRVVTQYVDGAAPVTPNLL